MRSTSELRRRTLMAALLAAPLQTIQAADSSHSAHPAQPAHPVVQDFDAVAWETLLAQGPRPAAYVFTTTWCASCPVVFEQLHAHIATRRRRVELAAVVMDAQGEAALHHAHHYKGITRLYAFSGFAPAIRHAVDPAWRNVTPYVVLIDERGSVQRSIGPPTVSALRAWL